MVKRQFYAYLKQRTKTRPSIGPLKGRDGEVVSSNKEMACMFNEFFSSVFTRENMDLIPEPSRMIINSELREVQTGDNQKSQGEDQEAKERSSGRAGQYWPNTPSGVGG